ncbi:hypothetical protein [Candidatus Nitrosocosmicus franklandus]|uniref:hypothetical protein n=1 Tax=Candidatus Nitrosocosmicus franklandianus TaxID=1798806 RepID=UPI00106C602A|nr:hypothetical protein [Candidatus Nitrosocosmicus franklandus]
MSKEKADQMLFFFLLSVLQEASSISGLSSESLYLLQVLIVEITCCKVNTHRIKSGIRKSHGKWETKSAYMEV